MDANRVYRLIPFQNGNGHRLATLLVRPCLTHASRSRRLYVRCSCFVPMPRYRIPLALTTSKGFQSEISIRPPRQLHVLIIKKYIFIGSTYPSNVWFSFEKSFTAHCSKSHSECYIDQVTSINDYLNYTIKIIVGSKYPKHISFSFENTNTNTEHCVQFWTASQPWVARSVAVLAEILLRPPRKLFVFIIKSYIYRIKVSEKNLI